MTNIQKALDIFKELYPDWVDYLTDVRIQEGIYYKDITYIITKYGLDAENIDIEEFYEDDSIEGICMADRITYTLISDFDTNQIKISYRDSWGNS